MWSTTPTRRTPQRRRRVASPNPKRVCVSSVISRSSFRVIEVVSSAPPIVRQSIMEDPLNISVRVLQSGYAVLIATNRILYWHVLRPYESCQALSIAHHEVYPSISASLISLELSSVKNNNDNETFIMSLTYITYCGVVYCFDVSHCAQLSEQNHLQMDQQRVSRSFLSLLSSDENVLCATNLSSPSSSSSSSSSSLSSSSSSTSSSSLSSSSSSSSSSCGEQLIVVSTSQRRLFIVHCVRRRSLTSSSSSADIDSPVISVRVVQTYTNTPLAILSRVSRFIGYSSNSISSFKALTVSSDHVILGLTSLHVEAFRIANDCIHMEWSDEHVLDSVRSLFMLNQSAENFCLVAFACVGARLAVVGSANTTAGCELCVAVYQVDVKQGLQCVVNPRALQLPPEWNIEEQVEDIQVSFSDEDESLLFVHAPHFVFVWEISSQRGEALLFNEKLLGGGRVRQQRACFFVSETHGIIAASRTSSVDTSVSLSAFDTLSSSSEMLSQHPKRIDDDDDDDDAMIGTQLLLDAFSSFQQARVSNSRTLVERFLCGKYGVDDVVISVSVRIVNAMLPSDSSSSSSSSPSSPLQAKQSRHASFIEFCKAIPSSHHHHDDDDDEQCIWRRLTIHTQCCLIEHGANIDVATAALELLHAPVHHFPQISKEFYDVFDTTRHTLMHRVMIRSLSFLPEAIHNQYNNMIRDGVRIEDVFFSRIHLFHKVLPLLVDEISDSAQYTHTHSINRAIQNDDETKNNENAALKIFFVVRAFRVMLVPAERQRDRYDVDYPDDDDDDDDDERDDDLDERAHRYEHVLRSWTIKNETRSALIKLIHHLVHFIQNPPAVLPVRADVPYLGLNYLGVLLLNSMISECSALKGLIRRHHHHHHYHQSSSHNDDDDDIISDVSTLTARLDNASSAFNTQRKQLCKWMRELAPKFIQRINDDDDGDDDVSGVSGGRRLASTQRYATAFDFAESFDDCDALFALCELCGDNRRSDMYAERMGEAYALARFRALYEAQRFTELFALNDEVEHDALKRFLVDKPRLSWVMDIDEKRFEKAAQKLVTLARDPVQISSLHERKMLCGIGKLALMSLINSDNIERKRSAIVSEFDVNLALIDAQQLLDSDENRVMSLSDIISALLAKALEVANDESVERSRTRRIDAAAEILFVLTRAFAATLSERERTDNIEIFARICTTSIDAEQATLKAVITHMHCESGTTMHVARVVGLPTLILYRILEHASQAATIPFAVSAENGVRFIMDLFNEFVLQHQHQESLRPLLNTAMQYATANLLAASVPTPKQIP